MAKAGRVWDGWLHCPACDTRVIAEDKVGLRNRGPFTCPGCGVPLYSQYDEFYDYETHEDYLGFWLEVE